MTSGIGYSHPARDSQNCIHDNLKGIAGWLKTNLLILILIDGLAV